MTYTSLHIWCLCNSRILNSFMLLLSLILLQTHWSYLRDFILAVTFPLNPCSFPRYSPGPLISSGSVLTRHLHGQDSCLARSLIIPSSTPATSVSSPVILFLTAFVGIQNEYYSLIPLLVYCLSLPLENKLHKGPQKFVLHVAVLCFAG